MTIRSYKAQDGCATLRLWNVSLKEDKLNKENFYTRIICDANFDPSLFLLAEEAGEVIGFIYGAKGANAEKAYIVAMGVCPAHRRKGIATELVNKLESTVKALGAKSLDIGNYAVNYFFPGIDEKNYKTAIAFFSSLGYEEKGTCSSMDMSLREYETPAKYVERKQKLESEGYTFGSFTWEDSLPMFEFFREHFPHWLGGARSNVLRGNGHETIQLARNPKGEVVGYAMRAGDGTPGRFGPFGVAESEQGTGLGGILFHNLISDMVERRIFYTWFLWTGGRNLDIYGTWGMKKYRNYTIMGKVL
ncbi:MAG: GNAT family N-acetyltransferase [Defluviitaleaceae bacterium]|nr:GNAT family N-acetyltransferase [Defluviitaleaceae bacterium]